jgi:nucleotide-binding universal stress UspA family protein
MKMLLAVDGSPYSTMATNLLTGMHLGTSSTVTVVGVVPEHTFLGGLTLDSLNGGPAREQRRKAEQQRATELVQGAVDALKASGVATDQSVCRGEAAEEIIRKAQNIGADLLVVGAKGTDNMERFPIGNVAHKVVKYADCSVMLAKKWVTDVRRVLLATDGSDFSDAAARFLLELPLPAACEVVVISILQSHIETWIKTPTLDFETNRSLLEQLRKAEEEAAASLVGEAKKLFRDRKYRVSSIIRKGEPAQEILSAAAILNPDLIVVGVKGLTGVERFLLGSVSQRVARHAKHSVLVVRSASRRHDAL